MDESLTSNGISNSEALSLFFFSTKSIDNSALTLTTVHWQFDFDAFGKPWIKFASNSLTDFGKPLYILFGWSMAYTLIGERVH